MLEVIGLILAIIDFTGRAPALEARLAGLSNALWKFMDELRPSTPGDGRDLKGWAPHIERRVTVAVFSLIIGGAIAFLWASEKYSNHPPYPLDTFGDWALLVIGFVLGFAFACVVAAIALVFIANMVIWLLVMPLTVALRLMSIPKKGILGSIGLLVAAFGVYERFH